MRGVNSAGNFEPHPRTEAWTTVAPPEQGADVVLLQKPEKNDDRLTAEFRLGGWAVLRGFGWRVDGGYCTWCHLLLCLSCVPFLPLLMAFPPDCSLLYHVLVSSEQALALCE